MGELCNTRIDGTRTGLVESDGTAEFENARSECLENGDWMRREDLTTNLNLTTIPPPLSK
jgi:hypothetical protein